jgi:hypothetical protein
MGRWYGSKTNWKKGFERNTKRRWGCENAREKMIGHCDFFTEERTKSKEMTPKRKKNARKAN